MRVAKEGQVIIGMTHKVHVSVRDQFYTSIFFPLNEHLQAARAKSHLFVSPQKNLITTCLPQRLSPNFRLLVSLTQTQSQQAFSSCFSVCCFYFRIRKRPTDTKALPTMPVSPRKKKSLLLQTSPYYIIRPSLIQQHHY